MDTLARRPRQVRGAGRAGIGYPRIAVTAIVALHLSAALIATPLGLVQLLRRKGTPSHRVLGYLWIATMIVAAVSSFGIQSLTHGHGFSYIHLLSIWTLIALTIAFVAIRRRNYRVHRGFMIGSYLGLVGAGIAAVAMPGRVLYVFLFG
jgi:uncharacterized membrane protein